MPSSAALLALIPLVVPLTPGDAPPSRALLSEFASEPRLAGTSGSLRAAKFVRRVLEEAGWSVEFDERAVCLSLPRRLGFEVFVDSTADAALVSRLDVFDPDALPAGDIPKFNAWTAEGQVRGPVVDAGHGLRLDFERLEAAGIDLAGSIALCRYGRGYRGVKARLAASFGCAGVLLFSDPAEDGAQKGAVWPEGPWKPGWDAQRGSILPIINTPGDPSTPGFASPAPGAAPAPGAQRLEGAALDAVLPSLPCLPIGADDAGVILERLAARRMTDIDGTKRGVKVGPGPVQVQLDITAPREVRTVRNVIARIAGTGDGVVVFGGHRDSWVRGAHDAGGGCVSLLRAAQHLGQRARDGWKPEPTLVFAFWDAEEPGLLGSTEWGEANADWLRAEGIAYVNADAAVSGTQPAMSGSPGLESTVARALERVASPNPPAADATTSSASRTLLDDWRAAFEDGPPRFRLPGSGSDFTVFLHHLTLPVLNVSFGGNSGGQYHTSFDDFSFVERYLDPGFVGHELSGRFLAELAQELCARGTRSFDGAEAARELARHATQTRDWLGAERADELAQAFEALAAAIQATGADAAQVTPRFYAALAAPDGVPRRGWYKNRLWTPGRELGYGSETFPGLRDAVDEDERAREYAALLDAVRAARAPYVSGGVSGGGTTREGDER